MSSISDSAAVPDGGAEWIETDGLGGFASGTVSGIRTRRYHALLLAATTPPAGRCVLVNGLDAWVERPAGRVALTSQPYAPDTVHPDGAGRIESFDPDPWPRWVFLLDDGTRLEQEIFAVAGAPVVAVTWRLREPRRGGSLTVRPFLSGRDFHALHRENPSFRFDAEVREGRVAWRPYPGIPGVVALTNGRYDHEPLWYRNFLYQEERARGLDHLEDLAAPGTFRFDLSRGAAVLILSAEGEKGTPLPAGLSQSPGIPVASILNRLRGAERRRREAFPSRLQRSADAYVVRRGAGKTIIAGYPWFGDWGRDTFIALRGLCLATGRLDEARDILLEWSGSVSEGMLPNRFPDSGESPEYNSVDAALWYVVAVHDLLAALAAHKRRLAAGDHARLREAVESILSGYARGTRYGIRLDGDGLLAAGEPGVQLTWMDAKVGDWVVTPRVGKPVEIQALWINALSIAGAFTDRFKEHLERGRAAFAARFWNEAGGCLFDVVDPWHQAGTADPIFRPNQIFAVGGLPLALLDGDRARRVVDAVEARLLTPIGLRSLAPGEPGYAPRYQGGVRERDGAYHQGTVWPWLIGPFVEAWVRSRGGTAAARREARSRFLQPLLHHLDEAGLGHLSEIADAEPPHAPRGCPFQAWSLGEALRLDRVVLAETSRAGRAADRAVKSAPPVTAKPGAAPKKKKPARRPGEVSA
ncbi:MAG TPA: amylo-alpha-1,6-glucosidase [Candidatus Polarisedimenticolia bacterium]|nr:amylo-alpha-1,6-glucosidase [Candidatus Polarisedimenticolia bacterium]